MSVILQEPDTGKIVLMCKGADSIIAERLSKKSKASAEYLKNQEFVDKVADDGLRTLFLAERVLDTGTFNKWYDKKKAAMLEVNDREAAVAAVDEEIETELTIVGTTAIEDKLQEDVKDTI